MPHLFLDLDGVLADFEAGVKAALGMSSKEFEARHGRSEFWHRLARAKDFYATLPLLPDAMVLFGAVEHLHPTILTGLPIGKWAAPQKVRWAAQHFPGTKIITTMARDKYKHMTGMDVLVDDRADHRERWKAAGGTFIHHKTARDSLRQLAKIYPSVVVPD